MASKRAVLATSIILMVGEACLSLLSIAKADTFPIDSKLPDFQIIKSSGLGTEAAYVEAQSTVDDVKTWCENWYPGKENCVSDNSNDLDTVYKASADCHAGTMTDPQGMKVKWSGLNRGKDWNRFYEFTNVTTGKKIGFSNADGGVGLMAQWMTLCPFGLPYSELPKSKTIDVNRDYPRLRDRDVQMTEHVGHNGSLMVLDKDLGVVVYREPKYKSIAENTVLFRGSISLEHGVPTRGMAYAFKKGCEPQPYYVNGFFENEKPGKLILSGEAPIWDGCNVKGYSSKSKNAKLVFDMDLM